MKITDEDGNRCAATKGISLECELLIYDCESDYSVGGRGGRRRRRSSLNSSTDHSVMPKRLFTEQPFYPHPAKRRISSGVKYA